MKRPKQPDGLAREKVLQIRLTKEERAKLDAKARAEESKSAATWARMLLLDEEEELEEETVTPLQRLIDELLDLPPHVHDFIRGACFRGDREERRLYELLSDLIDLGRSTSL